MKPFSSFPTKNTYMHRHTLSNTHTLLTPSIICAEFMMKLVLMKTTYEDEHKTHPSTSMCWLCRERYTYIAVTTKAQIQSTPKCVTALTLSASESVYVYMQITFAGTVQACRLTLIYLLPDWLFFPFAQGRDWVRLFWWTRQLTQDCHAAELEACGYQEDSKPPWRWPLIPEGTACLEDKINKYFSVYFK